MVLTNLAIMVLSLINLPTTDPAPKIGPVKAEKVAIIVTIVLIY